MQALNATDIAKIKGTAFDLGKIRSVLCDVLREIEDVFLKLLQQL